MELQRINHRHEQIINWLIANPDRPLGDCAREFEYTQVWLSQVIHSDAFQALYTERARELHGMVVHTLKDRLVGLAVAAMDRSQELLETHTGSERFVGEITKTALGALGMEGGGKQAAQKVEVNVLVGAETIAAAHRKSQEKRFGVVEPASREVREALGDYMPEEGEGRGQGQGQEALPATVTVGGQEAVAG